MIPGSVREAATNCMDDGQDMNYGICDQKLLLHQ